PELRDCGAGQTIDQIHLYGTHVVWEAESALPDASLETLSNWRDLISRAVAHSLGQRRGPVHLNVPLRDPLPASVIQSDFVVPKGFDLELFCQQAPITRAKKTPHMDGGEVLDWARRFSRGLIVAGAANPEDGDYAAAVDLLAKYLGCPILADALNPLRHACSATEGVIWSYDAILRNKEYSQSLRPDAVIQLGQLPTSKVLRDWLKQANLPTLVFSPGGQNLNPLHRHHRTLANSITDFSWPQDEEKDGDYDWRQQWLKVQDRIGDRMESRLECEISSFEGKISWLLSRHLPDEAAVFVANSMPVRDAEYFWPATKTHRRIFSNRGANGIDGTLGTSMGVAEGVKRPTVLLTGDLSLLHDSNAFLLAKDFEGSLTILLVNNGGGGIFNHLPVARENPYFERFWATPQTVDFGKLAAAHQVEYSLIQSWDALVDAIKILPGRGLRLLEFRTDRAADVELRGKLLND
ncbi:MAG: 2-succinyl-5-enolpyruvyl-6-hydroxy-3-cyclohexene-1-carboxylic-acid synthase, partial [Puniceicoccales bacterium]|nr:2-succinyl-5-enolpyruvyl-6-hydroxy-3-cyclohexene-1-carboxylic-acid synthase [Puniceicoccales bacterium]